MGLVEIQVQTISYNPRVGEVTLLDEVLNGLRSYQKNLPPKLFYDQRGSQLFDQICELEEYYLTRTETAIMRQNIAEISAAVSPAGILIEYGSGSSVKTRWMLDHLTGIEGYVPVDISQEYLYATADRLSIDYPYLPIFPVWADFNDEITLPPQVSGFSPKLVYFPGSTLGNFYTDQAVGFLKNVARLVGPGGGFLIGIDLQKDADILNRAYNDQAGITAVFNLNMLTHLNSECHSNFDVSQFEHFAYYNQDAGRIEMHLISKIDQRVNVNGTAIDFFQGESILTEVSYKFTLDGFARLTAQAGFCTQQVWLDPSRYFSVQYLVAI